MKLSEEKDFLISVYLVQAVREDDEVERDLFPILRNPKPLLKIYFVGDKASAGHPGLFTIPIPELLSLAESGWYAVHGND